MGEIQGLSIYFPASRVLFLSISVNYINLQVSWCVIDALTPKHYFAMELKSFYPIDREK